MISNELENDQELQRVLWACYKYWRGESLPPHKRIICYSWVASLYEERFGTKFHQSKLARLAKLGLLEKDYLSRHGQRRYYTIVDPDRVDDLLWRWGLD